MLTESNSKIILSTDAGMYGNVHRYLIDQEGQPFYASGYDSQHGTRTTSYNQARAITWADVPRESWTSYQAYLEDRKQAEISALASELLYLVRLRKELPERLAHYRARRDHYLARKRAVLGQA